MDPTVVILLTAVQLTGVAIKFGCFALVGLAALKYLRRG